MQDISHNKVSFTWHEKDDLSYKILHTFNSSLKPLIYSSIANDKDMACMKKEENDREVPHSNMH